VSDETDAELDTRTPYDLAPGMASRSHEAMRTSIEREHARLQAAAEQAEKGAAEAIDKTAETGREIKDDLAHPEKTPPPTLAERIAAEQLLTLKRSPTDWEPRQVTIGGQEATQVCGRRVFRDTVVVFGASAAVTLWRSVDDATGGGTRGIPLATGASVSLDTEGPIYATGTIGTTLDVIETYWAPDALVEATKLLVRAMARGDVQEVI